MEKSKDPLETAQASTREKEKKTVETQPKEEQAIVADQASIEKAEAHLQARESRTLRGHSGVVSSVAFSPDGRTLASGSDDNTIKLWGVRETEGAQAEQAGETVPADLPGEKVATDVPAIETAGGMQYYDLEQGDGARPREGDTLVVHYTGWLLSDGTRFDSSKGKDPFEFTLGGGHVIKGFEEGLRTIQKGGRRKLIIPPELGYGAQGKPPAIPRNATLVFDVELVDLKRGD